MGGDKYHHGDLKQQLIDKGLLLLNEEGVEGFSLRKVAKLCGVSHTAPYKHFKDKDMLIEEIAKEVEKNFYMELFEAAKKYNDDAKIQLVEMGKAYIKFMVENPEYFKFMFLSDNSCSITIKKDKFSIEGSSFEMFKNSSENYFKEIKLDKKLYMEKTLAMWSLIHGLTILITQKSVKYDGDYLELADRIIQSSL